MRKVFSLLLWVPSLSLAQDNEFCPCRFNIPVEEEPNCRVYGQVGDGVLIPWQRGSSECLDFYNLKVRAIDEQLLMDMCPNGDGSGASASFFVNGFLRASNGAAANGIKLSLDQFFVQEAGSTLASFPDTITDPSDGSTVDCAASESNCWNVVRDFFTDNPDALAQNCVTLWNTMAKDLELEQSVLRIRLCQETLTSVCDPLWSQVQESINDASNSPMRACSAYGLGPAEATLPNPDGCPPAGVVASDGSTGAGSTTSAVAASMNAQGIAVLLTAISTAAAVGLGMGI